MECTLQSEAVNDRFVIEHGNADWCRAAVGHTAIVHNFPPICDQAIS